MMNSAIPIITIDGPSGVGKGTLSLILAEKLKWHLLDSGSIYRVLALFAQKQLNLSGAALDESALATLAMQLPVSFHYDAHQKLRVFLAQEEITTRIRDEDISALASKIAVFPKVRAALLQKQRDFAARPGLIADGRDMGTVVFPNAGLKLFLDASVEIRAKRRFEQLQAQGIPANIASINDELIARDARDRNRSISPLKPANDAHLIDTTDLTIEEVVHLACLYIKEKYFISL